MKNEKLIQLAQGAPSVCGVSYVRHKIIYCRLTSCECKITRPSPICKVCKLMYWIGEDAYCHDSKMTCEDTKKRSMCQFDKKH